MRWRAKGQVTGTLWMDTWTTDPWAQRPHRKCVTETEPVLVVVVWEGKDLWGRHLRTEKAGAGCPPSWVQPITPC